jgi:hypothetical protein
MTVKEYLPNYLSKAAMYQELANFYKYRDPGLHIYYYLQHIKNLKKESQRILTTYKKKPQALPARLRVFHSNHSQRSLDVYIDGSLVLTNLSYRERNQYLIIPPGKHQISLHVAGKPDQQLLNKSISLAAGRYYTLVTTEDSRNQNLLAYEDQPMVPVGEAKIRFLHFSPSSQEIDIAVKNRDVIFSNLHYGNATSYLGVTPMKLELEARRSKTKEVILELPLLSLEPNTAYTAIILDNDVILWSDIQHS